VNPLRHDRGTAMVTRVFDEARALVGATDARRVADAVQLALAVRESDMSDDHDSRYLHPGRTVRVLLADVALRDVAALETAPFIESVDAQLAVRADGLDAALIDRLAAVPRPGLDDDDALEQLITADEMLATVALAERLDHARHLHMRDDVPWQAFHASIRAAWIPAARRIAPPLARRFEHWADAFERRLVIPL
jgi:hypothetical protein